MDYKPNEFVNAFLLASYVHPKGAKKAIGNEPVTDFINVAVQRLARANAIFIGKHQLDSLMLQMVAELDLEDDFPADGISVSVEDIIPAEHKPLFELQMRETDDPEDLDDPLFPWDGFKQVMFECHGPLLDKVYEADNYNYQLQLMEDDTRKSLQRLRLVRMGALS